MITISDIANRFQIPPASIPKLINAMSNNSGRLTGAAAENHTGRKIGKTILPELGHALRQLDAQQIGELHAEQPTSTGQVSDTRQPIKITSKVDLQKAITEGLIKKGDTVEVKSLTTPKGRDPLPAYEIETLSTGTVGLMRIPSGPNDTLMLLINDIKPRPAGLDTPNMPIKTHSRNLNLTIIPKED